MLISRTPGRQQAARTFAVLDIGSSKVCCLIAGLMPPPDGQHAWEHWDRRLVVLGLGHQRSRGIEAGEVVDSSAALDATRAVIGQAEQMARLELSAVHLAVTCGRPRSRTFQGHIALATGAVEPADIRSIDTGARAFAGHDGDAVIALSRLGYRLDGHQRVREPAGMAGERLHADHHAVLVDVAALRNVSLLVEGCHLDVAGHIPAALASALAATTVAERERGITCVDIGAGVTSLAAFVGGQLIHVGQITAGGQQMTDDIARALVVPLAEAERIKTLYAMLVPTASSDSVYSGFPFAGSGDSGDEASVRSTVAGIVRRRSAEMLEQLGTYLAGHGLSGLAAERLVLTGGASQLPGLAELAAVVLQRDVRASAPAPVRGWPTGVPSAAFSCLIGLVAAACVPHAWGGDVGDTDDCAPGYLGRMERWLRDSF